MATKGRDLESEKLDKQTRELCTNVLNDPNATKEAKLTAIIASRLMELGQRLSLHDSELKQFKEEARREIKDLKGRATKLEAKLASKR